MRDFSALPAVLAHDRNCYGDVSGINQALSLRQNPSETMTVLLGLFIGTKLCREHERYLRHYRPYLDNPGDNISNVLLLLEFADNFKKSELL
jgi:hypothetical protein